jgi:tetraacyldisaccharide 4'-kinase
LKTSAALDSLGRRALAAAFGLGTRARNAGYDAGVLPVRRVTGAAVISVGNLRAGGSGKTPLAMHLAARLGALGHRPALLLRGYRGRLEHRGGAVSRGDGLLVGASEAGDEAIEAARRLGSVQVRVGADRMASARAAVADGADVILLDDGFQHRRIHRDLDLLLVGPEDLEQSTRLLPAGPLREPIAAAARADLRSGFAADWEGRDDAPDVLIDYEPVALVAPDWSGVDLLVHRGARAHLLAGIARPERFVDSAARAGFEVAGASFFYDHHRYSRADLDRIDSAARDAGADLILTTEKDLARLDGIAPSLRLRALRIDVRFVSGERLLERFLRSAVRQARPAARSSSR